MSLQVRYKPKERSHRFSVYNNKTKRVLPVITPKQSGDELVDINQIRVSFEPESKRNYTLNSFGNFIRHSRGAQIYNTSLTKPKGGKKNKNTKKHKSRKNRTKRRKRF
jgi:hypothetical protein